MVCMTPLQFLPRCEIKVCTFLAKQFMSVSGLQNSIHSFSLAISKAPLQVLFHSEALPTTARIFTPKDIGNCW